MQNEAYAVIINGGKILLVKYKQEYIKEDGYEYSLPGGYLVQSEDMEKMLEKKIKDQIGLDIEVGDMIASKVKPNTETVVSYYSCFAMSGFDELNTNPKLDETVESVFWVESRLLNTLAEDLLPDVVSYIKIWNM
jgi:ADP-ribose pyrophosphatase YjhB (NUDIX family)